MCRGSCRRVPLFQCNGIPGVDLPNEILQSFDLPGLVRQCGPQAFEVDGKRYVVGGFPGADKVLAQIDNPATLARKRVGLVALERVPVREHTELQSTDGQKIGEVTSGLLGPTVNEPVAMGYVTPAFAAIGTRVNAIVRGKVVPMEVRAMPFVPANYYRG